MNKRFNIQPDKFQYILLIGNEENVLPHAPSGWEEKMVSWGRNEKYYGLVRTFSVPLKFVLDGAWILRREFYTYGIEANVTFVIKKLNPSTWKYQEYYSGEVNFYQFKDNEFDVEVTITEGGLSKFVKAYENTKYEIELTGEGLIDVKIDGIKLQQNANWITKSNGPAITDNIALVGQDLQGFESIANVVTAQNCDYETGNSAPNFSTSNAWFYKSSISGTISVSGTISLQAFNDSSNVGNQLYGIALIVESATTQMSIASFSVPATSAFIDYSFPFDFPSVALTEGDRLFIIIEKASGFFNTGFNLIPEGLKVSGLVQSSPTLCKAIRPKELFKRLVEKMAGPKYQSDSYELGLNNDIIITSGDALRRLPNAKIKTSFSDFFQSFNSVLNLGFGIENGKAIIEKKNYFFKQNLPITDLGEVKDFKLEPAQTFIYNTIKIGYPDQKYDQLNGRDEYNTTQIYSTPITRIAKELNLVSTYRADMYGIEFTRINLEGKATTDNSSDNDTFMIVVEPYHIGSFPVLEEGFKPKRSGYLPIDPDPSISGISGVISPETAYNLDISPKKNLLRHSNYLAGMLDRQDSYYINFQTTDKNENLVTINTDGKRVAENENIQIKTMGDKLFLPYVTTIATKSIKNIADLINVFQTGFIKFSYQGNSYEGFILEASTNPANNETKQFKLLLTSLNNLVNLIR